jgi:Na+/melibiose symporter-like transporter
LRVYLREHLGHIGRSLTYALSDRHYLILFFTIFIYQAGILAGMWMYTYLLSDWFGGTWNTPFAERWLTGPLYVFRDAFFLFIFFGIGCGTLFLPFWNWLGTRIEKRACMLAGILGVGLTYGASYLLFAPQSFPLFIVYCVILSFFYCAVNVMPVSMLADIATNSELERGEANEGMFFGANSFLTKVYNAAAQFWTGFALEHIVHYRAGEHVVQSADALHRMRLLYAVPPVVTALIAVVVLLRYDLTRAKMAEVTRALEARRGT